MARITVDVGLDDFDLDDILEHLEYEYDRTSASKLTKESIEAFCEDIIGAEKPKSMNLVDEMKLDLFMKHISSISIERLEQFIKS